MQTAKLNNWELKVKIQKCFFLSLCLFCCVHAMEDMQTSNFLSKTEDLCHYLSLSCSQ